MMTIEANYVDIVNRDIFPAKITVNSGKIAAVERCDHCVENYLLPGFVDAHIHIESSMLPPSEFARLAVCHGTVATVSDPHEIANVLGMEGVEYMLQNSTQTPFKCYFGASPCVPATLFETNGATLGVEEIETLLKRPQIKYLSEVMNFPGVIYGDPEICSKIEKAKALGKPVDGHAPGLREITLETEQDTIISLADGIGALRALVAQRTFAQEDLERIKKLFKQIEQEYNEKAVESTV